MLARAEKMYAMACRAMDAATGTPREDVSQEDEEIHIGERMVRRMILEHLTFNPRDDLPASLAIISIVHDVERIGDYCKSLIEIDQWDHVSSGDSPYAHMCHDLHEQIRPLFAQTVEALRESNSDLARKVMRRHEEIKGETDRVFATAMEDADANRETVLHTLAARLLRRVSAHLSNVASSVANPLDRVGDDEVTP